MNIEKNCKTVLGFERGLWRVKTSVAMVTTELL